MLFKKVEFDDRIELQQAILTTDKEIHDFMRALIVPADAQYKVVKTFKKRKKAVRKDKGDV